MSQAAKEVVGQNVNEPQPASKGSRFAALLIDFLGIPFLMAITALLTALGLSVILDDTNVGVGLYTMFFLFISVGWPLYRDAVYSPAREMLGLQLISLKTGGKPSFGQILVRNIFMIIPFINQLTCFIDCIGVLSTGDRVADGFAKTRVIVKR